MMGSTSNTDDLQLEENVEKLEKAPYVEPWRRSSTPSVHVCVGGACSQNGSHTTLAEIEDLVEASGGGCKVETDWCFGRCGAGPNVLIVREGKDRFRTGVGSLEESIRTVTYALGRSPALDAELGVKLKEVRRVHALEQDLSRAEMLLHISACTTDDDQYDQHLASALKITDKVVAAAGAAHPLLQAHHLRRLILGLRSKGRAASRDDDILECEWERVACWRLERVDSKSEWSAVYSFTSSDAARVQAGKRGRCGGSGGGGASSRTGTAGADRARTWHVTLRVELDGAVLGVSGSASAAGGSLTAPTTAPTPKTAPSPSTAGMRKVLIAEDSDTDDRPPTMPEVTIPEVTMPEVTMPEVTMPEVIERDYTPLSSEDDLERGELKLLIKIYSNGKATQYLKAQPLGAHLWFSPPQTTLVLPSLRPPASKASALRRRLGRVDDLSHPELQNVPKLAPGTAPALDFASVVLVAGGTGIAPMWQILQQAKTGVVASASSQLSALPMTIVYSCRADDALLIEELAAAVDEWPRALLRVFVTVTDAAAGTKPAIDAGRFPALSVSHGRIEQQLLSQALRRHLGDATGAEPRQAEPTGMPPPPPAASPTGPGPRVVVCGPASFGSEMATLISRLGVSPSAIVTLQG